MCAQRKSTAAVVYSPVQIPDFLSKLAGLRSINFYGNRFSGTISSQLANLQGLSFLNLGGNAGLVGTIPMEIAQMSSLTLFAGKELILVTIPS